MNSLVILLLVAAGVLALLDWWSVATERVTSEYVAKPLVIVALVGVALAVDTGDDTARGLIIAALGASLVGDVVLMAPDGPFEGGLGAFLVAHVLYIIAMVDDVQLTTALFGAIVIGALALGVLPQLLAATRERGLVLAIAVGLYAVVVSTMAVVAVGTGVLVAGVGGVCFLGSDALLGWNRFVAPAPGARALVHAGYHIGQAGLVTWLAV